MVTAPSCSPVRLHPAAEHAGGLPPEPEGRIFFPNLDGLRFLAFFLVYLQHGFGVPGAGGFGVSFFFVLSGFLITYLILAEIDRLGRVDLLAFYTRRALRIWPLYYAVLAFAFVVYPLAKRMVGLPPTLQAGHPAWYVFFLGNFDVLRQAGGLEGALSTNVTWSVAIEEQFYVAWPLLFRLAARRFQIGIFAASVAGSFLFRVANRDDPAVLYFHTASVVSDMAVGGFAAYAWRRWPGVRRVVVGLSPRAVALFYALAGIVLLETWLGAGAAFGPGRRLLMALVFAGVVLEQNFVPSSPLKMSRCPRMSRLGRYTYGLYLLHTIVVMFIDKLPLPALPEPGARLVRVGLGVVGLGLSMLAAWASYTYLERPFLLLKDRFSHVRSGPRA